MIVINNKQQTQFVYKLVEFTANFHINSLSFYNRFRQYPIKRTLKCSCQVVQLIFVLFLKFARMKQIDVDKNAIELFRLGITNNIS